MRNNPRLDAVLPLSSSRAEGKPWLSPRTVLRLSGLVAGLLMVSSWVFVLSGEKGNPVMLFSDSNLRHAVGFLRQLMGLHTSEPAFLRPEAWWTALRLSWQTLQMSVLGIGFAGLGMILTVLPAARVTAEGSLTLNKSRWGWAVSRLVRSVYVLARAVPELFWAMMIIFLFKPGILPGALALGLHNFGILGKLCAEVIEDLDLRPVRALRSSGAGLYQILIYGILPMVLPKFLTYLMYRWEEIIRASIVVGFVSAGGLGMQFKLSMNWFHYTEVMLYLLCYVILVWVVDLTAGALRALAKY